MLEGVIVLNIPQKTKYSSSRRLREMIIVLRKHNILRGNITPEKMRLILEDLGPTFVKLGQILSLKPGFLPADYALELTKLQTRANPLDFAIIEKCLENEYNKKLDDIFEYIDPEALGSASIAQVHKAILKNGEKVVLKVQRPGIYDIMAKDIVLLKRAVSILQLFKSSPGVLDFNAILDEMWSITKQEMDFMTEAEHIDEFRRLNSDEAFIDCPYVKHELTTARVLAMEYIDGIRIDEIDKLKSKGYNVEELGFRLGQNYVKQIVDDGYFHADPHPGNIWIKNGKIIWLDLGMMGRLSTKERDALKRAVFSLVQHDTYEMKNAVLTLGKPQAKLNHISLYEDIDTLMNRYGDANFQTLKLSELAHDIITVSRKHKIAINPGLSMFARGVVTIESVLKICCPDINFIDIFSSYMKDDFKRNFSWQEEFTKFKRDSYIMLQKSLHLPEQVSDILKMTMSGQTKVNLDVTGSEEPLRRLDKMINKLILGIICSALLLGSSIICTTNMTPQIMEIPILGVVGYLVAVFLSIRLMINIYKEK